MSDFFFLLIKEPILFTITQELQIQSICPKTLSLKGKALHFFKLKKEMEIYKPPCSAVTNPVIAFAPNIGCFT